jgi:esterase/lipase superfamily enzyme
VDRAGQTAQLEIHELLMRRVAHTFTGPGVGLLWLLLLCGGCVTRTYLVATPYVCLGEDARTRFQALPPDQQRPEMEVLYAADRGTVEMTPSGPKYGSERAGDLCFGAAVVEFSPHLSWAQLVEETTSKKRRHRRRLDVKSTVEYGRLALSLKRMDVVDGRYRLPPDALDEIVAARRQLHQVLHQRLAASKSKSVYIFVHGFNNSFEDSIFRVAQLWHFMGRQGVPIAYSWPAGRGGLFGYAYDRESGEFTVFHLKRFIVEVASCPDVERIHLLAHSRGTDVAISALRELNIEFKALGRETRTQLKLHDVMLAAPDVDADVFEQRFAIEDLHLAANRTTVYLSPTDLALTASSWLFGDRDRLGNLSAKEFTPDARKKLAKLKRFDLIECDVSGYSTSHDYAFAHPAVVSDVLLLLGESRAPGAENGRPLDTPYDGMYRITNDYLRPQKQARHSHQRRESDEMNQRRPATAESGSEAVQPSP